MLHYFPAELKQPFSGTLHKQDNKHSTRVTEQIICQLLHGGPMLLVAELCQCRE